MRGRVWHVVQDPANNAFFRLHPAAYRFVGLLDGRRSVAEAWQLCQQQLGDEAPTQGEALGVLGRLYVANLLQGDLPPDARGLFERHRRRRGREVQSTLANFLFLRVPLFDPDRLLTALDRVIGGVFSLPGLIAWAVLVGVGAWFALGDAAALVAESGRVLGGEALARSLPLTFAAFAVAKLLHELAHGLAVKHFGRREGGGEVHVMGVMFLVLAPLPYVDASGAWAFRDRRRRIVVALAGMLAELAAAAAAAIAWAWTADAAGPWGRGAHDAAYRLMFVASVATLLFNANPLLKFDGYYVLSDLAELPNLADRSRRYLAWLVKRHVWGVTTAANPATGRGEAAWLAGYGLASLAFRAWICVRILLLLIDRLFVVGVVLALAAAGAWLVAPAGRFLHYLATSPELHRVRRRAVGTTLLAVAAVAALLVGPGRPDRWRVEGVVVPGESAFVHAGADGFVRRALPPGTRVGPDANAPPLVVADNDELSSRRRALTHEREALEARLRLARLQARQDARHLALVQIITRDLADLDTQMRLVDEELAALTVRAPMRGTWLAPPDRPMEGTYVRAGERLGQVLRLDRPVIRATATPRLAGLLLAEARPEVDIRLAGRPQQRLTGTWELLPAAVEDGREPHPADPADPMASADADAAGFELRIRPDLSAGAAGALMPGQAVVVRFDLPARPLAMQWWRSARDLLHRRFGL